MTKLAVLYVDDEPDIREVAALSLGLDPHIEVRTVESGAAALDALADASWSPSVILLDVMMPVLDGPGTLTKLRAMPAHEQTPVVFITARAQVHEQLRLLALGATGVISKPFDPMTLAAQLRSILAPAAA